MNKFIIATLSTMLLSASAAQADTFNDSYVSILGGWSSHPAQSIGGLGAVDNGYNVGARVGTYLDGLRSTSGFSLEADYFYNRSNFIGTGGQFDSSSFMSNLIYHIPTNSPLGVYGGAGIGAVNESLDGTLHGSSTVLGWQALGGAEYAFNQQTSLFAEYRYQNAHDANIGAINDVRNTSNNISVGLKFHL